MEDDPPGDLSWTRKTVFWRYTTFYNEIVCKHCLTLRERHVFQNKNSMITWFLSAKSDWSHRFSSEKWLLTSLTASQTAPTGIFIVCAKGWTIQCILSKIYMEYSLIFWGKVPILFKYLESKRPWAERYYIFLIRTASLVLHKLLFCRINKNNCQNFSSCLCWSNSLQKKYVFSWLMVHSKTLRTVEKKLAKNLGEKTIQQKMLKKIIYVAKKSINFDFIKVYKVSPNFAGEKSRWPRPNSKTYLFKIHWNSLRCASLPCQTFDVSKSSYRFFEENTPKCEFIFLQKKHEPDKKLGPTRNTSSHLIHQNSFSLSTEKLFSFNCKVGCCQSELVQWLVE